MVERKVTTRLDANVSGFVRGMAEARAAVGALNRELNTSNDSTSWLAGSLLALAPAAVPIGATLVPAVAALGTQAGLAAAGAGVMALAFVGVGDALQALNKAQLDPTKANLHALDLQMKKLGPDGAEFVKFLDSVGPQFNELRKAARAGLFPGVEQGITEFLDRVPDLKDAITAIATTMGQLSIDAGKSLSGPEFDAFFEFLKTDAQPILLDTGRAFGNFIHGLTSMVVAFSPTTQEFSQGLLNMSRSFEHWAQHLGDSRSFQEFINYVHQVTPEVKQFVGQLISTFVDLSVAAAPIGKEMLPLLTSLLEIVGAIAKTPLGPFAIAAVSVSSLVGRLIALRNLAGAGVVGSLLTGQFLALGKAADTASTKVAATGTAVSVAGTKWRTAGLLGVAALGYGLTQVETKSKDANAAFGILGATVTGAAIGSQILPGWGTAIGTASGAVIGLVSELHNAEAAEERAAEAAARWRDAFPTQRELNDLTGLTLPGVKVPKDVRPIAPERTPTIRTPKTPEQVTITTKYQTLGVQGSVADAAKVARAQNLTPKEVRTRLTQTGWTTVQIRAVIAEMRRAEALGRVRSTLTLAGWSPSKINTAVEALSTAKSKKDVVSTLTKRGWETRDIAIVAKLLDTVGAKKPAPKVAVAGVARAIGDIRSVSSGLASLHDKTVTITTVKRTVVRPAAGGAIGINSRGEPTLNGFDTGGAVRGGGTETSDSIPAMLSNGEHVLTAADVRMLGGQDAVYRMRSQAQAGLLHFALGGAVAPTGNQVDLERAQAAAHVNELERQLGEVQDGALVLAPGSNARRAAELELNEAWAQLSLVDQHRAGLLGDLRASMVSSDALKFFEGDSSSPWMSGGSFGNRALAKMTQIRTFAGKLLQLRQMGLNGALLSELYGLGSAQGIAAADELLQDSGQIAQLNSAYAGASAANQFASAVSFAPPAGVSISVRDVSFDPVSLRAGMRIEAYDAAGRLLDAQNWDSTMTAGV